MHVRMRWPLNLIGALGIASVLWIAPATRGESAPAANAYQLLAHVGQPGFPYSGTEILSYTRLPWYLLPAQAVGYAGTYRLQVHFAVASPTHFRVDMLTISPALESGSLTVAVNGRAVSSYDSRTNTASRGVIPWRLYRFEFPFLLSYLQGGSFLSPGTSPTQSIQQFLTDLRSPAFPLCLQHFARIIRQGQLLGRPVDVIDFGPLQTTAYITGCTFSHPGHCVHHAHSRGYGRVWVARGHPFVLQYTQYGLSSDVHNLDTFGVGYRLHVTSLHRSVNTSALRLNAPVPVMGTGRWNALSSGSGSTSGPNGPTLPPVFLIAGAPAGLRSDGSDTHEEGPLPRTVAVNQLFSTGRKVTRYTRAVGGARRPFGLYVAGPYVLIQERIRANGLPASLRSGPPQTIGRCPVWSGTYADGQRWVAFSLGRISVLTSTNALSPAQLLAYVGSEVCPR